MQDNAGAYNVHFNRSFLWSIVNPLETAVGLLH